MATFTYRIPNSYDAKQKLPSNSKQFVINKKQYLIVKCECIKQDNGYPYVHLYYLDRCTNTYELKNRQLYPIQNFIKNKLVQKTKIKKS